MPRFINAKYPDSLDGAERAESALEAAQQFSSLRGLALLLLSAMAAAVMVVAYEVMDTPAESHLLMLWVGVWAVAFAVLAVLANMTLRLKGRFQAWSQRLAQSRADRRLWAMAQQDSRLMADLQLMMMRQQAQTEALAQAAPAQNNRIAPEVKLTAFMASRYTRDYI